MGPPDTPFTAAVVYPRRMSLMSPAAIVLDRPSVMPANLIRYVVPGSHRVGSAACSAASAWPVT